MKAAPPFRLELIAWALKRRAHSTIDRWDGKTYSRALALKGGAVEVAVSQDGPPENPVLLVQANGPYLTASAKAWIVETLERLLGLRINLDNFHAMAKRVPMLQDLTRRFYGFKPPRYPSLFEALANAICCQQITLTQGITMLNRLAEAWGERAVSYGAALHAFPRPAVLAKIDPESLRELGFSATKARSLVEAAEAFASGAFDADRLSTLDDASVVETLTRLRGVGPWSAQYVLLRGLGRLNVFPAADSGALSSLRRLLGREEALSAEEGRRLMERWRPYSGLVYFHLLLNGLAEAGNIQ